MKITALIPARSGSKRISSKNIKNFCGHPLLAYTIQIAKDSELFDDIYVSTDDSYIGSVAKKYGADWLHRPKEFAQDDSPDIDWIKDVLSKTDAEAMPDIIVILRPTNPFRTVKMLVRSMIQFLQSDCDSMRAVEPVKQHPYKMWKNSIDIINEVGCIIPFEKLSSAEFTKSTQSLAPCLVQNGSLEIMWEKTVSEQGNVHGKLIQPYYTEGYEGFDINEPEDFILAEELVKRGMVKLPEVKG